MRGAMLREYGPDDLGMSVEEHAVACEIESEGHGMPGDAYALNLLVEIRLLLRNEDADVRDGLRKIFGDDDYTRFFGKEES